MDYQWYYEQVAPLLENVFDRHTHYALFYGDELRTPDWDSNTPSVAVVPKDQLHNFTIGMGLEAFVQLVGTGGSGVMMAFDVEYASKKGWYCDIDNQKQKFQDYLVPIIEYFEDFLGEIDHAIDFTPSGFHILAWFDEGTPAFEELVNIGYVGPEGDCFLYHDHNDLKRNPQLTLRSALAADGVGKFAEFMGASAMQEFGGWISGKPICLTDTHTPCVNIDLSWTEDPMFMRIIRTPFSAHKKKGYYVDAMMKYQGGNELERIDDLDYLLLCMRQDHLAVMNAHNFSGFIPVVGTDPGAFASKIQQYRDSDMRTIHLENEADELEDSGIALEIARNDPRVDGEFKVIMNRSPDVINSRDWLNPGLFQKMYNRLLEKGFDDAFIQSLYRDRLWEGHPRWMDMMKYSPDQKARVKTRRERVVMHLDDLRL